ncbi:hypothetical protein [Halomarina oriensis]|uniref:Uncharacterized protein n=1 Tax=Halomarina oriensis TaxID=671145 RepID=A0A6B0GP65_9EURY|nr:hypothetical protein [Halomarina oriensis]MWG36490.1 hypothetical protein [Halomarina oriensis]
MTTTRKLLSLMRTRHALAAVAIVCLVIGVSLAAVVAGVIRPRTLSLTVIVVGLLQIAWSTQVSARRDSIPRSLTLATLLIMLAATGFGTERWIPAYAEPAVTVGFGALLVLQVGFWGASELVASALEDRENPER